MSCLPWTPRYGYVGDRTSEEKSMTYAVMLHFSYENGVKARSQPNFREEVFEKYRVPDL